MVGCVRCKSIAAMSVTTAKMRTSSANDSMVYERRAAGFGRNGRRRELQVPPIETAVSITLADTGSIGRMVIRAISRGRRRNHLSVCPFINNVNSARPRRFPVVCISSALQAGFVSRALRCYCSRCRAHSGRSWCRRRRSVRVSHMSGARCVAACRTASSARSYRSSFAGRRFIKPRSLASLCEPT
jgi:hypothetical protein